MRLVAASESKGTLITSIYFKLAGRGAPPLKKAESKAEEIAEQPVEEKSSVTDAAKEMETPSEDASKDNQPSPEHKVEKRHTPKRPPMARPPPPGKAVIQSCLLV